MKKLAIGLLLLSALYAHAQVDFGVKVGGNMNKFVFNDSKYAALNMKFGIVGGLFLRVQDKNFYFQADVLFSQRNGDYTYTSVKNSGLDTTLISKMNYIDVPLFVGFRFGKHVRIGTGPVLYFLKSQTISYKASGTSSTVAIDNGSYNSINFGWQAGLGIDVQRFCFDLRYELGLSPLVTSVQVPNTTTTLKPQARSNLVQFTVGYKFINK